MPNTRQTSLIIATAAAMLTASWALANKDTSEIPNPAVSADASEVETPAKADKKAVPYAISYTASKAVKAGTAQHCSLAITPTKDHYIKKSGPPFSMKVTGSSGVEMDKAKYSAKDFVDPEAHTKTVQTAFKAKGDDQTLEASLRFFVCNAQSCTPYKETQTCSVSAK